MVGGSIVLKGTAAQLRQDRELLEASYLGVAESQLEQEAPT
jgi:hypothetical protein